MLVISMLSMVRVMVDVSVWVTFVEDLACWLCTVLLEAWVSMMDLLLLQLARDMAISNMTTHIKVVNSDFLAGVMMNSF